MAGRCRCRVSGPLGWLQALGRWPWRDAVARATCRPMNEQTGFLAAWGAELTAQRMQLRKRLNESRASLIEFGLLTCLLLGSLGLVVPERGFAVAPWGVAIPFVYLAAMLVVEVLRQRAVKAPEDVLRMRRGYGRITGAIGFLSAAAGLATFIHAVTWGQSLPPPEVPVPEDLKRALDVTIN